MKFAEKIFPKGTFKGQETDGAYLAETLALNLNILAKKITDDMHFLGIITGNDSVGNGKSTMATQIGSYLTNKINELHGLKNTFTHRNVCFNSKELTTRSPNMPQYSVMLLDEGDDLTTHGMKELAVRLKRYFRKCRQLNQIVLLILPSFFELPKFYALSRSHFLINVQFKGEYERGYFQFFGPQSKKFLYIKGKKEWDYAAQKPDFDGRFFSSYCFFPDLVHEIELYKKNKWADMVDDAKDAEESKSPARVKLEITRSIFKQMRTNLPNLSMKELSKAFGIGERTGFKWINEDNTRDFGGCISVERIANEYDKNSIEDGEENVGEEEVEDVTNIE